MLILFLSLKKMNIAIPSAVPWTRLFELSLPSFFPCFLYPSSRVFLVTHLETSQELRFVVFAMFSLLYSNAVICS